MLILDPTRVFQVKGQSCKVLSQFGIASVGTNRTAITAQSGKVLRVMGWIAQANGGTTSQLAFLDGSGGSVLSNVVVPPSTNGVNDKLPIVESGYFETTVGNGLFVNITTTDALLTMFYIAYIP